jgi:RTX calcium-binding nonapeptide repeat (4 copies)
LSSTGILTDTGEVLNLSNPVNVYCAPGAKSGVVIQFAETENMVSSAIPGLLPIDGRFLSGGIVGRSGTINSAGNRVFARSCPQDSFFCSGPGSVDVFNFNSATGALGASPLLTFPVAETPTDSFLFFGIEQIALHPNGRKLFVSEPSAVNVYNARTGFLIASITDPNIVSPTGVTVVTEANPCAGNPPPGAIVGTNGPNILNGTPSNDIIFGLGGPDIINGGGGNDLICGGAGNDVLNGGAGNDIIGAGAGADVANGGPGNDTVKSSQNSKTG